MCKAIVNKNYYRVHRLLIISLFLLTFSTAFAKGLSPLMMGLKKAKTGIDRYWVLYNTHLEAAQKGLQVDYSGIDSLIIEIPNNARPIPIKSTCDFRGLRLQIVNKEKDMFLFGISHETSLINVEKVMIDNGDFSSIPELSIGNIMLFVRDLNPWVKNRLGYNYGATRNDCLILKKGKAKNAVIMPYNNSQSNPQCSYVSIVEKEKVISNLSFKRDVSSTHKTFFIKVYNQNGVTFKNIATHTPQNDTLFEDRIYWVENCANIRFKNCTINGTYSQRSKWGYGIYMDNVYNSLFKNLKTNTNWGVFCTRSVNMVTMKSCHVNRFDTHCYGRNIVCEDCVFTDRECSYTSFYGDIIYKRCVFEDCIPVHIDYTYDAYTPFHLIMKNCILIPSKRHDSIIMVEYLLEENRTNRRGELRQSQWPVVTINGLKIKQGSDEVSNIFLFKFLKTKYKRSEVFSKNDNLPTDLALKKISVDKAIKLFQTNMDFDNEEIN